MGMLIYGGKNGFTEGISNKVWKPGKCGIDGKHIQTEIYELSSLFPFEFRMRCSEKHGEIFRGFLKGFIPIPVTGVE